MSVAETQSDPELETLRQAFDELDRLSDREWLAQHCVCPGCKDTFPPLDRKPLQPTFGASCKCGWQGYAYELLPGTPRESDRVQQFPGRTGMRLGGIQLDFFGGQSSIEQLIQAMPREMRIQMGTRCLLNLAASERLQVFLKFCHSCGEILPCRCTQTVECEQITLED